MHGLAMFRSAKSHFVSSVHARIFENKFRPREGGIWDQYNVSDYSRLTKMGKFAMIACVA